MQVLDCFKLEVEMEIILQINCVGDMKILILVFLGGGGIF